LQQITNQKYKLHWFQTEELLSSSYLPLIFWFFPRIAVERSQADAFWAVLGIIIVGLIVAALHAVLNDTFPSVSGIAMLNIAFGKWLAKGIGFVYLAAYLLYCAVCVYFFVDMLRPFHMHTPRFVMIIALCLVAMYGATRGVETLARVSTGVHLSAIIGLTISVIITFADTDWYWRPHLPVSWSLSFHGVYCLLPLYFGFNLFLMINPYYEHKPHRSLAYAFLSMVKTGFIVMATFIAVIARFGEESTQNMVYPVSSMIQLIRLNGWIIERVGIFAITIVIVFTVLFTSNHIWALSTLTAQSLNLPDEKFHYFVYPLAAIILIIALIIPNEDVAEQIVAIVLTPLVWLILIGIPLTVLVLGSMRRKKHT
jgi:spore germination protein (amino acid permease)